MWGLWLFPLIILLFIVGAAAAVLWYFASAKDRRPKISAVVAVPIGCAAAPIIGLALLATFGTLFQRSDTQLYEEIFGYRPSITEDRMLFDDFGDDADQEIFMRTEPTDAERKRLMAIPGLEPSEYSPIQFVARGAQHGFSWWTSTDPVSSDYCKTFRIQDAHGFRGWREFRIAECLDGGAEFPANLSTRLVYVVASGRS